MKSARRITEQHIRSARFRGRHRIVDDRCRVCPLLPADHLHTGAVGPLPQLVSRRCAERIRRCQHNLFSLILHLAGKLAHRRRLTDTVDTDDEHHRLLILKAVRRLPDIHLLLDTADQKLLALGRILNVILLHLLSQISDNRFRRPHTDISHDQNFLDLLVKFIVNAGITPKNRIDPGDDIVPRLPKP